MINGFHNNNNENLTVIFLSFCLRMLAKAIKKLNQ